MRNAVQGGLIMVESDMLPSCKWLSHIGPEAMFDGWFTSDDVPFHHQRDDVR